MQSTHDLFDFIQSVSVGLAQEYDRIQKRATEDPGTAGDQGEENWATIFRDWLPPTYRVVTKGRIISHEGIASPQVDVLVLHPAYPNYLLDKKLYLASGVAAAFECKLTLKAEHINDATKNAAIIRRLLPQRSGSPFRELNSPIIYGLLAHSYSWKGNTSLPIMNIDTSLKKGDQKNIQHPREMLSILCVADLATWVSHQFSYFLVPEHILSPLELVGTTYFSFIPKKSEPFLTTTRQPLFPEKSVNIDTKPFTPIGTLLYALLNKLAWEDISLRQIAEYFKLVEIGGGGAGAVRRWPLTVYSDEVKNKVVSTISSIREPKQRNYWDEWSMHIE